MRAAAIVIAATALPAAAHDLRPGILAFVEDSPDEVRMRWIPPVDSRGEAQELPLVLPAGCTRTGDRVRCRDGFHGEIAIAGMRGHAMKIYVTHERAGVRRDWVLTSEAPRITIAPAPSRIPWPHVALFAALLLACEPRRTARFVATLLVFVAAHVAAALVGIAPAIAATAGTLVLARSALRTRSRWPWLVAACAGAMSATASLPLVGAELAVITATAIAARLIGERGIVGLRAHRAAAYALGALAAYWLVQHACG